MNLRDALETQGFTIEETNGIGRRANRISVFSTVVYKDVRYTISRICLSGGDAVIYFRKLRDDGSIDMTTLYKRVLSK